MSLGNPQAQYITIGPVIQVLRKQSRRPVSHIRLARGEWPSPISAEKKKVETAHSIQVDAFGPTQSFLMLRLYFGCTLPTGTLHGIAMTGSPGNHLHQRAQRDDGQVAICHFVLARFTEQSALGGEGLIKPIEF